MPDHFDTGNWGLQKTSSHGLNASIAAFVPHGRPFTPRPWQPAWSRAVTCRKCLDLAWNKSPASQQHTAANVSGIGTSSYPSLPFRRCGCLIYVGLLPSSLYTANSKAMQIIPHIYLRYSHVRERKQKWINVTVSPSRFAWPKSVICEVAQPSGSAHP